MQESSAEASQQFGVPQEIFPPPRNTSDSDVNSFAKHIARPVFFTLLQTCFVNIFSRTHMHPYYRRVRPLLAPERLSMWSHASSGSHPGNYHSENTPNLEAAPTKNWKPEKRRVWNFTKPAWFEKASSKQTFWKNLPENSLNNAGTYSCTHVLKIGKFLTK